MVEVRDGVRTFAGGRSGAGCWRSDAWMVSKVWESDIVRCVNLSMMAEVNCCPGKEYRGSNGYLYSRV